MKLRFFIIFIMLASPLLSGPGLLFDTLSIRGLSLAGSFSAVTGDPEVMTVNPAGLASVDRTSAGLSYISWFEDVGLFHAIAGIPLSRTIGVLGISIAFFSLKGIPNYDDAGDPLPDLSVSDITAVLGLGKEWSLLEGLATGLNIKFFSTKLGEANSLSLAFDLGVQKKFSLPVLIGHKANDNLATGLAIQNLGFGQKYVEETSSLPQRIRTGLNYMFWNQQGFSSSLMLEFSSTREQGPNFSSGLETSILELFRLRIGYKLVSRSYSRFSAGLGLTYTMAGHELGVDYTILPSGDFGLTHAFGLKFSF